MSDNAVPEITFPSADGAAWSSARATEAGFDCSRVEKAVEFAQAHETSWSRDLAAVIANSYFEPPPGTLSSDQSYHAAGRMALSLAMDASSRAGATRGRSI